MPDQNQNEILNALAQDLLKEKRVDRRWKNIRFFLFFILILFFVVSISNLFQGKPSDTLLGKKYVALIRLDGMIAPGRDFSAVEIVPVLEDAFKDKNAEGIVIDINSPGGTPVQASIIHDAIITFKQKYHKKVIIVGEDLLTSGAYFVAVAADKIYVNPNTITGSIGVIVKGFGFVDLMKKIGVERRVYTAGADKDRLDPFLPQNPEDLKKINEVIGEVHENFVQAVLAGRKGKLKVDPASLFNGDFWSGKTALKFGLIDGLGNLTDTMQKEFNTMHYKEYTTDSNFLRFLEGPLHSMLDTSIYLYA